MQVDLTVDGVPRTAEVTASTSLLTLLRDGLHLVSTKNACEQGECGSCSVWLDGDVVCACLVAAAQARGGSVRTIESVSPNGGMHPVQRAFVDAGAVQCGFCTPGLVVSVVDLLRRDPLPSDQTIREELSGNLCRCTGYQKILEAVHLAAARMAENGR